MTQIFKTIQDWTEVRPSLSNKTIGFVPTMGNLHAGHQSLLKKSKQENDISVLSIFVNPTQFNDPTDLEKYPRTLKADVSMAEKEGIDFILHPTYESMYPDNYTYQIVENPFSKTLCGKFRPGHFDGVLTIVMKLIQWVQPTRVYFGEKDYQQYWLIQQMKKAFFLPVDIIPCPTVYDENGLALSSRNARLSPEEYQLAIQFAKLLHSNLPCDSIVTQLKTLGIEVDYIEEQNGRRFGAVKVGKTRLIDNMPIDTASHD